MTYLKALAAAVIAGLGALQIAYVDNHVTTQEWINIAIVTVIALGGVWAVPNGSKKDAPPAS